MTAATWIYDDAVSLPRLGGGVELYLASVEVIDHLRTHHLASIGLPADEAMTALWREAASIHRQGARAPEVLRWPLLFFISDTGRVLDRWAAMDRWDVLSARLQGVPHAA